MSDGKFALTALVGFAVGLTLGLGAAGIVKDAQATTFKLQYRCVEMMPVTTECRVWERR